eukprot:3153218-Alexandrium_andersonii.AAC.1
MRRPPRGLEPRIARQLVSALEWLSASMGHGAPSEEAELAARCFLFLPRALLSVARFTKQQQDEIDAADVFNATKMRADFQRAYTTRALQA